MKAGDRVKFTCDIYDDACGDHPFISHAIKGDTAVVERVHDDFKLTVIIDDKGYGVGVAAFEVELV